MNTQNTSTGADLSNIFRTVTERRRAAWHAMSAIQHLRIAESISRSRKMDFSGPITRNAEECCRHALMAIENGRHTPALQLHKEIAAHFLAGPGEIRRAGIELEQERIRRARRKNRRGQAPWLTVLQELLDQQPPKLESLETLAAFFPQRRTYETVLGAFLQVSPEAALKAAQEICKVMRERLHIDILHSAIKALEKAPADEVEVIYTEAIELSERAQTLHREAKWDSLRKTLHTAADILRGTGSLDPKVIETAERSAVNAFCKLSGIEPGPRTRDASFDPNPNAVGGDALFSTTCEILAHVRNRVRRDGERRREARDETTASKPARTGHPGTPRMRLVRASP